LLSFCRVFGKIFNGVSSFNRDLFFNAFIKALILQFYSKQLNFNASRCYILH